MIRLAFALAALALPVWAQPPAPVSYLPQWYVSAGGGAVVPGSSKFAYTAAAVYLGQATYLTTVNEYTFRSGQAQSCTLGGVTKVLYQFAALSIGTTPLGGGCTTAVASGGAAVAVQGFASFRLRSTGVSLLATADKTFTEKGAQAVKLTLGVSYAFGGIK